MGIFDKFSKKKDPKVFVLSLDGMPYSFAKRNTDSGNWPAFKRLIDEGDFKEMYSVMPPISSVAWSSFQTGKNPAKHNVFGFVDRDPKTFELILPNSKRLMTKTLIEILSDNGKKVISINVPVTYPPKPVNGIVVGGFLSPNLQKAVYPVEKLGFFEQNGYIVDADSEIGHRNSDQMMDELFRVVENRFDILFKLLEREEWDFFIHHVMETDRMYHFFWDWSDYAQQFDEFHKLIDFNIEKLLTKLPEETEFMMLSDHGFTKLNREINLNYVLWDRGFLHFTNDPPQGLINMAEKSRAYSFIPGRVFVNLEGREKTGTVKPGAEFDAVIKDLMQLFDELTDPETGDKIVQKQFLRDEVYSGEFLEKGADLLVLPHNGYDFKASFRIDTFFEETDFHGMHTYDDAFFYVRGHKIKAENFSIMDLAPSILNLFGIDADKSMDGNNILHTD
ncbi:MAG: hypothetical protein GY863_06685 [bacterium]|nr:hypothetical protein [bacterium]